MARHRYELEYVEDMVNASTTAYEEAAKNSEQLRTLFAVSFIRFCARTMSADATRLCRIFLLLYKNVNHLGNVCETILQQQSRPISTNTVNGETSLERLNSRTKLESSR